MKTPKADKQGRECGPIRLTPSELIAMLKSEQTMTLADKDLQLAHAMKAAAQFQAELADVRAGEKVQVAQANYHHAKVLHGKLAATLSERYAFDWQTHDFDDETGDISPRGDL